MKINAKSPKLTLSVEPKYKKLAMQLSKTRRRSISKLFEDWIETESLRESDSAKELNQVRKSQKHRPRTESIGLHPPKKARRAA